MNKNKAVKQYEYRYDEIKSVRSKIRERSMIKKREKTKSQIEVLMDELDNKGDGLKVILLSAIYTGLIIGEVIKGKTSKNAWTKNEYKRKMMIQ